MAEKKRKTLEQQIHDIYDEAQAELEAEAESFFHDYEEDEAQRKDDEKILKVWLLSLLLTRRWKTYRHRMAERLTEADITSAQITNEAVKNGFLRAFLATGGEINGLLKKYRLKGVFRIYNKDAVKWLQAQKKIFPVRKIPSASATAWHESQINRIMQAGIIQGKSIQTLSREIRTACRMSAKASIRASRTAMTGAHGAGTQAGFEQAEEQGIELEKEWMSAFDDRTRDSHAEMDGERVPVDQPFSNGLMFPGDPNGPPEEVWNCRCNMRAIIKGINEKERYGKAQYGRH